MERIKLNLIPSGVAPVVHLSQYDEGRKFGIDLFEGDSVYVLDGTETLTVNSRKPDGHVVVISVTNTGTSSLEVDTVEQLTAVHGTSYAKLKIEKGSDVIATLEFLIAVSRDPLENGDPSESFVDNLNTQISNAVADQYDSNNVIFDNDPTTGHGIGYAVTSEGIKTTIDNLKVGDLSDVTITTPTSGEALTWDGSKWVNGTVSTVGSLDDLNDVDTTGKVKDSSIVWDGSSEFVAKKLTEEVTQAEYDQLKLDGDLVEGVHYVITDGQNVTCNLGDLNDVDTSGASTGDLLAYNNGTWEKTTPPTVASYIKVGYLNATTNASGFCNISGLLKRIVILNAWSNTGDVLIIPFSASGANDKGANQWWFRVHNDSMQIRASFNFPLYYAYIELE